jgi:thermostable 8-oxoguanine DNA glycosylase
VRGYNAIKDLGWVNDKEDLRRRLIESKCGMYNNRTEYIWKFRDQFYADPSFYCEVKGDWVAYRNKIVKEIVGLGIAKVSFSLELCFPEECAVFCGDTHMIQLYELKQQDFKSRAGVELYENVERHWLAGSAKMGASPTVARAIYWDRNQNRRNSRYWSVALEK